MIAALRPPGRRTRPGDPDGWSTSGGTGGGNPADADTVIARRRNTELALLLLAVTIVVVAYALLGLSQAPALPAGVLAYSGALLALALAAHLVTRRFAPTADPVLLPVAFLLNGLGLVMVRRIDFAYAARELERGPLAPPQTLWTVVAVGAFCATLLLLRDHLLLDRYRYLFAVGSLVLLVLPLMPGVGREINGARLWLHIGPFNIQPAEIAKLGLVAFFASYLAEKRPLLSVAATRLGPLMVPPMRAFGPVALAWLLSLGILVTQNDFGLSLLFFGIFVVLLYIATSRITYLVLGVALFSSGAYVAYRLFPHVSDRLGVWLNPWGAPGEGLTQLGQSLFAFGTGGLLGVGLGQGRPDLIPFVQTDFIFAAFGEELGLVGATALLLCFFVFVGRGFAIAARATDDFSSLLAAGLTVIFGLQVFVILGGVTRLIPVTGLTLPFVSYGGSSLLANYMLVALLLRLSAQPRPEDADEAAGDTE